MQAFSDGGDLQRAAADLIEKRTLVIDLARTDTVSRREVVILAVENLKPRAFNGRLSLVHVLLDDLFIFDDLVSLHYVGVDAAFAACRCTCARTAS